MSPGGATVALSPRGGSTTATPTFTKLELAASSPHTHSGRISEEFPSPSAGFGFAAAMSFCDRSFFCKKSCTGRLGGGSKD